MGKKNKNKKPGQAGDESQGQQEQGRSQHQPHIQQSPLNPQREGNMPQQQQQQPKEQQQPQQHEQQHQQTSQRQQQQQRPQQQKQQQRPQHQKQQERPQQQRQQERPQHQQQKQQQTPQNQQQQQPQQPQKPQGQRPQQQQQQQQPQQQRPQQQQQQQKYQHPQQQRQQWPQQQQQWPQQQWPQQQQQRPQQQQWSQQQPSQQQQWSQQQQRPQQQQWSQQQQQQRPQQQQWSQQQPSQQQQWSQQQQRPQQQQWSQQQQQQRPQQQQWPQQQPSQQQQWSQQQQRPQQQQQWSQQQHQQKREQQWPHSQQRHPQPQHEIARSQSGSQQSISSGAATRQSSGAIPKQSQPSSRSSSSVSDVLSPHVTPRQESIPKSLSKASAFSVVTQKSIPPGTLGIKGEAEANYLTLDLRNMPDLVYHYDVTITPDRPKKFYRDAFNKFMEDYLKGHFAAFDGVRNCYFLKLLPQPVYEGDVQVTDAHGKSLKFNLSIKATENPGVELKSLKTYHNERVFDKPMRALQCIEVVLANSCHQKGVRAGRSFYMKPKEGYTDLGDGFELYVGLYQAAILGEQPYVNVDISHKSFPSDVTLTGFLTKQLSANLERKLEDRTLYKFCSHMRGLKVIYNPPSKFGQAPRSYKVNEISEESAANLSFTDNDGKKMTVREYFASRGYNLRYPHLNCVVSGSAVRPNYLPIELCSIEPGQAIKRKDGVTQVQRMIKFAATSTGVRKMKIMDLLYKFDHNKDPLVKAFGLAIGREFIKVPTRLLSPPAIEYHSKKCAKPHAGSWRGFNFLKTGVSSLKSGYKWAIIYTQSHYLKYSLLETLSKNLYDSAKRMGINLSAERQIEETKNISATLECYKKENYDLVVVVIPGRGTTYAEIKKKAELTYGLLTQCIKEQTVCRGIRDQTISNLLLKINSKLNGTNHKISSATHIVLDYPMFMGADVTHPSPDQRHIPSVVGVAASHDLDGASYNMQYRLQQSTKEEIEDMLSISRHHLKVYFQRQKCYPKHIVYYRDGVSDGQFQKVEHFEVGAIRAVCKELRISPKITCIIVVKRHHTRFFPITPTTDSFNNVLPGTVVDQKIVHPNETQFFMVSHQSIQGTAKPTRYNVIVDDAKFSMDQLQQMTNNLCYMFPRCNRAVSYPAPAYLAHLVAARGRVYIEGPPLNRSLPEEYRRRLINENFMNNTPMFFV